ncbi:MAG: HAD-IA family hydrolase [Hyphomicrobiales bacterium]|nr:HAD-IA family hydrolase [Hyphomicrobiales bacterium]
MKREALIFDVDGTLAETEEVHRAAFNAAFTDAGLAWRWDVPLYGALLKVTGGKERLRHYAALQGEHPDDGLVQALHAAKNRHYGVMMREGGAHLRPGVADLVATAKASGYRLAIATTTSRVNVEVLIDATWGRPGRGLFAAIIAGEDVPRKKPAPDAYLQALAALHLPASACLAFEDSCNGLQAARAAGLATIVTPGLYTAGEDFAGATAILPDLSGFQLAAYGA